MSRTCGSLKPPPTPLSGLAMKPGKARRKVTEGNADTVRRQTTSQIPAAYSQCGGGGEAKKGPWQDKPPPKASSVQSTWRESETKKGELKENTGAKTRETNIKTLPQATIVAGVSRPKLESQHGNGKENKITCITTKKIQKTRSPAPQYE